MKKLVRLTVNALSVIVMVLSVTALGAMLFEAYIYDYKGNSVVMLTKTQLAQRGGTGFIVEAPSGKKYTLTNAHICKIGDQLVAHTQNSKTHTIKVIEIYPEHDLCIMEAVPGLRALKVASNIDLHERVWLIGHPALRPLTLESGHFAGDMDIQVYGACSTELAEKVLKKIESKKEEEITLDDLEQLLMLMAGMCIKPHNAQYINNISYGGNSGSPVVNKFGNVVGVLFAGSRSQPTSSYTVPISEIHKFLKDK